jgi:hypothetical protein
MTPNSDKGQTVAGMAAFGGLATGVAGWAVALFALVQDGKFLEASLALAASALAFGLIANAVFRQ